MNTINKAESFLVFLNNLYIDLNCNNEQFLDLVSNKNSKVFRIATFKDGPTINVSRSILETHLINFSKGLDQKTMNMLLNQFIRENHINNKLKANA